MKMVFGVDDSSMYLIWLGASSCPSYEFMKERDRRTKPHTGTDWKLDAGCIKAERLGPCHTVQRVGTIVWFASAI